MRAIYYFHSEQMPLYLLTLFAKATAPTWSKSDRNELAELTGALVIWKAKGPDISRKGSSTASNKD